MTMQQTLRYGMGFCAGAPHGTEGTMVSIIRLVGPMGALQEGARPVVAKLNLAASVASRSMTGFHVRRDKAALIQRVQAPPGERSSRKQLGQAWR